MGSWKSTLGGLGAIAGGIVLFLFGKPGIETNSVAGALVTIGGGLIAARDKSDKE